MSHCHETHLDVLASPRDVGIRKLLPGYDAMLIEAMDAVARHVATNESPRIIDLGAGSGRLAAVVAERFPKARLTVLELDAKILEEAKQRFAPDAPGVSFVCGSFFAPLPPSDVAIASLSIHHVLDAARRREVYSNIRLSLPPGGLFVMCDAMVPTDEPQRERVMRRWAEHLMRGGDTESEAYGRFQQWAAEERYCSVEEELALLRGAGFTAVDLTWRSGPLGVVTAVRTV